MEFINNSIMILNVRVKLHNFVPSLLICLAAGARAMIRDIMPPDRSFHFS